jgi:5-methyltetrahydropteroyltriglutamate--homocysteine methyltransferase
VRDWGVKTLERAAQGLPCKSAVHICYGYGIEANLKWKQGLGEEWRQYEQVFPLLAKSTIDQVSLECQNSRVPMEFIAMLRGKDVLVGAIDVGTQDVETPQAVANVLRQALQYADVAHIQGCTNCGLVTLPREVATAKLRALAAGAALLSEELGLE